MNEIRKTMRGGKEIPGKETNRQNLVNNMNSQDSTS